MFTDRQLAELAIEAGLVTFDQLKELVPISVTTDKPLTAVLFESGIGEEELTYLHAALRGLAYVRADRVRPSPEAELQFPKSLRSRYCVTPLTTDGNERIYVAIDPLSVEFASPILEAELGKKIVPVAASVTAIRRTHEKSFLVTSIEKRYSEARADDYFLPAEAGRLREACPIVESAQAA